MCSGGVRGVLGSRCPRMVTGEKGRGVVLVVVGGVVVKEIVDGVESEVVGEGGGGVVVEIVEVVVGRCYCN